MKKALFKILIFFLRPFARPVRYAMLKLMKFMHNPRDRRPAIAVASHLIEEIALPSTFKFFKDVKFRELANFNKLTVSEHDRIFNELQAAAVCTTEYSLIEAKNYLKDGNFHFWSAVEEELPRQLQKVFSSFGIDSSNAKQMREFIKIRQREYENFARQTSMANVVMDQEVKNMIEKNLQNSSQIKQLLSDFLAVAYGSVNHIRRGKIEEKDPLVRYFMTWLLKLRKRLIKFVIKL